MANSLTPSVNLTARLTGAQDALKTMGLQGLSPSLKNLTKTRTGASTMKPESVPVLSQAPFTTSGTALNPKVAFFNLEPPNYVPASSKMTACASCKYYSKDDSTTGNCSKYDFVARADYSCDAWASRASAAPSNFK